MADFDTRVSEIRSSLDGLIDTIGRTDIKLEQLSKEFSLLVRDASKISDMVNVVERLNEAVGRIDIQGVRQLQNDIKQVATSLREINTSSLTNAAKALERQQNALQQIADLQTRVTESMRETGNSFNTVSASIDKVVRETEIAEERITQLGRKIRESFKSEGGLGDIARDITEFNKSISNIDSVRIEQSSNALMSLRDSLLSLNKVTFTGPKLEGVDRTIKQLDKLISMKEKLAQVADIPGVTATQRAPASANAPSEAMSDTEFREKYGVIDTKSPKSKEPKEPKRRAVELQERKSADQLEQQLSADPTARDVAEEIIKQRRRILNDLRGEFSRAYKASTGGEIGEAQYGSISKMLAQNPRAMEDPKNAINDAVRLLNNMFKKQTGIDYNNQKLQNAFDRIAEQLEGQGPRSGISSRFFSRIEDISEQSSPRRVRTGSVSLPSRNTTVSDYVENLQGFDTNGNKALENAVAESRLYSNINIGVQKLIGAGLESLAFLDAEGRSIVKISKETLKADYGKRSFDAPVEMMEQYGSLTAYRQPVAETNVTDEEYNQFRDKLHDSGYYFSDPGKKQVGRINGEVKLLDYGSVERISNLPGTILAEIRDFLGRAVKSFLTGGQSLFASIGEFISSLTRNKQQLQPRAGFSLEDRDAILGSSSRMLSTPTGDSLIDKFGNRLAQFVDTTQSLPQAKASIENFGSFIRYINPGVFIDLGIVLLKFYNTIKNITDGLGLKILPGLISTNSLNGLDQAFKRLPEAARNVVEEFKKAAKKSSESPVNQAIAQGDARRDTTRSDVMSRLSEQEILRTKIIESALTKLTGNTDLSANVSGYAAVNPDTLKKYYKDKGFNPDEVDMLFGASIPQDMGRYSQGFTNIDVARRTRDVTPGEGVLHEIVHSITDKLNYEGSNAFEALEPLARSRMGFLNTKGGFKTVRTRTSAIDSEMSKNIMSDKDYLNYIMKPEEIYSNIGQALLSGNNKMVNFFKRLYGNELFDRAIAVLRSAAPGTFSPSALAEIQQGFQEFDQAVTIAISDTTNERLSQTLSQISGNASHQAIPVSAPRSGRITQQVMSPYVGISTVNPAAETLFNDLFSGAQNAIKQFKQVDISAGIQAAMNYKADAGISAALSKAFADVNISQSIQDISVGNLGQVSNRIQRAITQNAEKVLSAAFDAVEFNDDRKSLGSFVTGLPLVGQGLGKVRSAVLGSSTGRNFLAQEAGRVLLNSDQGDLDLYKQVNTMLRGQTGFNVDEKSFNVQRAYDFHEGLEKISISARLASGAMVQLNGKMNEFNEFIIDPNKEGGLERFMGELLKSIPHELGEEFVQSIVFGLQQLVTAIISIQDELAEVALLIEGSAIEKLQDVFDPVAQKAAMTKAKSDFLYSSIDTASVTGQSFTEAVQTNVQNFKVLAPVKDADERLKLASELSRIQLGAQTAFGITLEESLESLPAIFAQIRDSIPDSISDPAIRAAVAVDELRSVMDKLIVAQRESGAAGSDLIQVYAQLAVSAKDAGLSQNELLSLTAAAAVKLNKSPVETANSIKSIIERTYGEGADDLSKMGIAVKEIGDDGVIRFRAFNDILVDAVRMMDEMPSKAKEISQAFGGRARANEFVKLASSIPEAVRIEGQLQAAPEGAVTGAEFDTVVERKRQVVTGAMNSMQASFGLLINQLLVGSGAFDDLGRTLANISNTFRGMADGANGIPQILSVIKDLLYDTFIVAGMIGLQGVNAFAGFAKMLNSVTTSARAFISRLTSGAQTLVKPIRDIGTVATKVFDAMEQSGSSAFKNLGAAAKSAAGDIGRIAEAAKAATAGVEGLGGVNAFLSGVTSDPVATGNSSFWNTNRGKMLKKGGEALGSTALPAVASFAIDGFSEQTVAEVGVGIAGGFAGFLLGGPILGAIGFDLARTFMNALDLYGMFATSKQEKSSFASYAGTLGKQQIDDIYASADQAMISDLSSYFSPEMSRTGKSGRDLLNTFSVSSADVRAYRDEVTGKEEEGFDWRRASIRASGAGEDSTVGRQYQFLRDFGLLDAYINSSVSSMNDFFTLLEKSKDSESDVFKLVKDRAELEKAINEFKDAQNGQNAQGTAYFGSVNQTLDEIDEKMKSVSESRSTLFNVPKGLSTFGPFGSAMSGLNDQYLGGFNDIASGKTTGNAANALFEDYNQSQQLYANIPSLLGTATPVLGSLGQEVENLPNLLQQIGVAGQQAFGQQIQQLAEMVQYTQEYELLLEGINAIQTSAEYNNPDISGEDKAKLDSKLQSYEQQRSTREALYTQYSAYLELIKAEPQLLAQSLDMLKAQEGARKRIRIEGSKGTPAQFSAPSMFDASEFSTPQLQEAINYALDKQSKLTALNPEYAKMFAKDQFLMESGGQFAPVAGVNQGFVSEYLQQQRSKQQKAPSLEDMSKYSDQEYSGIIQRARDLQSQAVSLAPDLAGKYDDERMLVLRKNNQVLQEVGIGQEFLRAALEDNTQSNEDLRGHYNLPGNYRMPTVWDYYDQGGKETGDVNFVRPGASGGVSLDFAQKLAQEMMAAQSSGDGKGPDLSALQGLIQSGSRPMFYPNPGTPGTPTRYIEPEPLSDEAIQELMRPPKRGTAAGLDIFDRHPEMLKTQQQSETLSLASIPQPNKPSFIQGYETAAKSIVQQEELKGRRSLSPSLSLESWDDTGLRAGGAFEDSSNIVETSKGALAEAAKRTKESLGIVDNGSKKTGQSFDKLAPAISNASNGIKAFSSVADGMGNIMSNIAAKVKAFDLTQALQKSNIQIQVTINGQTAPANQAQVTITNNAKSGGTSSLTAGPSIATQRGITRN